jgi:hypothetical protein
VRTTTSWRRAGGGRRAGVLPRGQIGTGHLIDEEPLSVLSIKNSHVSGLSICSG